MRLAALLAFGALAAASPAAAQEWRVGAQLGRISYNGALAAGREEPAVVLALSRADFADWAGVSVGLPIGQQQFWAAAGISRRMPLFRQLGLHLDFSAHGFAQRAPDSLTDAPGDLPLPAPSQPTPSGWFVRGAGAQAALLLSARTSWAQLEARAGGAAQASSIAGDRTSELMPVADARLLADIGPLQLGPEAQQWRSDVRYAGATARASSGPGLLWGSAGKWKGGGAGGVVWSLGGAVELGAGVRIEGSYRSPGYDPLYRSETAGSASLGASIRMGGSAAVALPVPVSYANGRAVIQLRARDARGTPSIAGDFSDWKPLPMTRSGNAWIASIPVPPGVYSYAFVNERGEWFVPESVPGRRSDGMGGWQALLVIE